MSDTSKHLRCGDVFLILAGDRVKATVPKSLFYSNKKGDWSLTREVVTVGGKFEYLAGTYIVTRTAMNGGGTGHGPHDVYPEGHEVTAVEHENPNNEVSFYQSGCFIHCWTRDVPVRGRATQSWVWEPAVHSQDDIDPEPPG